MVAFNFRQYIATWYHAVRHLFRSPGHLTGKRIAMLLSFFLSYPIWQVWIRLGWALDRLLYPAAARQEIREPVFIIGNFRSGTTFLHRLLATDPRFRTPQLWELYLAPSVTWRKLFRGIASLDQRLGGWLTRFVRWLDRTTIDTHPMHPTSFFLPEEDDLIYYHIWSTYLFLSFFPLPETIVPYRRYDLEIPASRRQRDMRYYRSMVQKHLYAYGGGQYLAKNPAQTPKIRTLAETFPDARFIYLVREPDEVLASSLKFFSLNTQMFGGLNPEKARPLLREMIIAQCREWYAYAPQALADLPAANTITICYQSLVEKPVETVQGIYRHFGWELSPEIQETLAAVSQQNNPPARTYTYSTEEIGLSPEEIRKAFAPLVAQTGCMTGD